MQFHSIDEQRRCGVGAIPVCARFEFEEKLGACL